MKRRILSSLMALVLVFGLLPATAFAEGETVPDGKAKIGTTEYATLDEALEAAQDGDTIQLGKGTYSGNMAKPTEQGKGAGKSPTFVGAGIGETTWQIQATKQYGSDGWWQCPQGHVWKALVYSRTGEQKCGCPVCGGSLGGTCRARYEQTVQEAQSML